MIVSALTQGHLGSELANCKARAMAGPLTTSGTWQLSYCNSAHAMHMLYRSHAPLNVLPPAFAADLHALLPCGGPWIILDRDDPSHAGQHTLKVDMAQCTYAHGMWQLVQLFWHNLAMLLHIWSVRYSTVFSLSVVRPTMSPSQ